MALDTANLCILTGNANPDLAKKIADHIGVNLCDVYVGHFNNGETQVMISESIRGKDIFIIQPTSYPVNDNLMELLIMADACKRASAHSITAVVPYYAYARQDRKTRGREPISAKLVANLMTTAGVTRVVTVDLHAGQIQGFFDIPVDHLAAAPVIANYFRAQKFDDVVVVSPDLGGVTRARILADHLQAPIAIIEKRRPKPGCAEVMNLIGDVEGKTAVIIDDIVDTAGSLSKAPVPSRSAVQSASLLRARMPSSRTRLSSASTSPRSRSSSSRIRSRCRRRSSPTSSSSCRLPTHSAMS